MEYNKTLSDENNMKTNKTIVDTFVKEDRDEKNHF